MRVPDDCSERKFENVEVKIEMIEKSQGIEDVHITDVGAVDVRKIKMLECPLRPKSDIESVFVQGSPIENLGMKDWQFGGKEMNETSRHKENVGVFVAAGFVDSFSETEDSEGNNYYSESDKKVKTRRGTNKMYECIECSYATSRKSNLKDHARLHTGGKLLRCGYKICKCTERCDCVTCDYGTDRTGDLKRHVLVRHSGEMKKYRCERCEYSMHRKEYLVRHSRVHTDEKPFGCRRCGYATAHRNALTTHVLLKHSGTEKKYKCGECAYSTHLKSSLMGHRRVHTTEKTFKCGGCNFATTQKVNLRNHVLARHGDEDERRNKPFPCNKCEFAYKFQKDLQKHVRRKHT